MNPLFHFKKKCTQHYFQIFDEQHFISNFFFQIKVSARDVIQLWEYGMGEVPPIKAWTKAQKFKQQSKISRWKKIVDIFKYQCNSDMRKFEEIYADGHGCLLPVAAITNRFETLYGDELNITSKLMTVPTPVSAISGGVHSITTAAPVGASMTSIHTSSTHHSSVGNPIPVLHRKRNLTDDTNEEIEEMGAESDNKHNLHQNLHYHNHHHRHQDDSERRESEQRDSSERSEDQRSLHLLEHSNQQQFYQKHHKRSYSHQGDHAEDEERRTDEMKTPPPPLLVSVGSPPPPKLVKTEGKCLFPF